MKNKRFDFLWQYIEHWATVDPDFIAMRYDDQSYTYGEFEELTDKMATAFLAAGIDKGDMIATMLPACPEYLMILIAADKIGAVVTALDVKYKIAVRYLPKQPLILAWLTRSANPKIWMICLFNMQGQLHPKTTLP